MRQESLWPADCRDGARILPRRPPKRPVGGRGRTTTIRSPLAPPATRTSRVSYMKYRPLMTPRNNTEGEAGPAVGWTRDEEESTKRRERNLRSEGKEGKGSEGKGSEGKGSEGKGSEGKGAKGRERSEGKGGKGGKLRSEGKGLATRITSGKGEGGRWR